MKHYFWLPLCIASVLSFLATPVHNTENPDQNSNINGHHSSFSHRNTINLISERTSVSKAMRHALLHLFQFHDAKLRRSEVILNYEQNKIADAKKLYGGGKRGRKDEFEEINIFDVEHLNIEYDEAENEGNPTKNMILSDQEQGYGTVLYGAAENENGNTFPVNEVSTRAPSQMEEGTGGPQDDIFLGPTSTCDHVTGYYRHRWLRLVVMCPSHWTNETVRKGCETWDKISGLGYIDKITMLPVQDSLGTVYGNAFCAICHNAYPIYPWTTVLQCDAPTNYNSKTVSLTDVSDLHLSFISQLHDNSFCKRIIRPSLPSSIERCENHHSWPKAAYFRSSPLESLGIPSSFPVNFNVLMNFDFTGETHILFSAGQQVVQNEYVRRCNKGETYDTYSNMCRPVRCGSSHRLEAGKCVPIGDTLDGQGVSDDFDVSALHETAKVSLSVNISFGLYLIFKEQNDLNSIVLEQIAENLNISLDRIKHVNVSFDFRSINKTGYQVQKLSEEKYREYFPNDTSSKQFAKSESILDTFGDKEIQKGRSASKRRKRGATESRLKAKAIQRSNSILSHENEIQRRSNEKFKDKNRSVGGSSNQLLGKTGTKERRVEMLWKDVIAKLLRRRAYARFISDMKYYAGRKIYHGKDNSFIFVSPTDKERKRARRTNELKPTKVSKSSERPNTEPSKIKEKDEKANTNRQLNQWQRIQELSFDHLHPNTSNWDTLWSLVQSQEFHEKISNKSDVPEGRAQQRNVNNVSNNLFKSENRIYLSPPLNEDNDRMLLGADSDIDFDQPMAMRISFILVPPDDPESDEEQAMVLLKKIADLITDREFTLLVSGNEVSVVNSDDQEEDEEKANQFCPWGVMFIVYDDEFSILEIDNITMLYVNKTQTYHGIGRFDLWVMVKGKNSAYETSVTNLKEYAFVCFMPRIVQGDCQRITLKPDEYKVMSADNRSILFEENEYNITTYSVLNETTGEIQICVPKSYDPNKGQLFPHYFSITKGCGSEFDDVRRAEGYLTIILGRISIAAQALVLLTYFLFPSLRNLPGCNIMNLTLALFIAETIFEEGMLVTTQWRCVTVAISLHFFFLASHFWMNVMSFDVFRAFSKPNRSTSNKTDKQIYFPKYFVYAWGMPAIIVGLCSFIEFSDLFGDVEIGYGASGTKNSDSNITFIYSNFLFGDQQNVIQDVNIIEEDTVNQMIPSDNITFTNSFVKESQTACWIQNPLASLIAFGAPIFIIFVSNCIFFTRTIINISRTMKLRNENLYRQHSQHSNSSYNKTTGRSEAMLYLRMSTVMGFTWVFGFSSAIISSAAKPITTTICVVVHVHSILFVIFNISQGLFIFFAFVCNRRVLRLYGGLFFRLKRFVRRQSHKSRIYSITSMNSTLSNSSKNTSISQISW